MRLALKLSLTSLLVALIGRFGCTCGARTLNCVAAGDLLSSGMASDLLHGGVASEFTCGGLAGNLLCHCGVGGQELMLH